MEAKERFPRALSEKTAHMCNAVHLGSTDSQNILKINVRYAHENHPHRSAQKLVFFREGIDTASPLPYDKQNIGIRRRLFR